MFLFALALLASLCVVSYALWKQAAPSGPRALPQAPAHPALPAASSDATDSERTLETLRPGDIVMCLDRDYLVEGSLSLDDDGRALRLHRLADGAAVRWLAVREGTPSPLLLDEDHELPIERGAPTELRHGGAPYRLERRASTRARRMGQVGPRLAARHGDRATLFEYAGVGDKRIVAVSWPDGTDGFVGATVHRALVEILPGA